MVETKNAFLKIRCVHFFFLIDFSTAFLTLTHFLSDLLTHIPSPSLSMTFERCEIDRTKEIVVDILII